MKRRLLVAAALALCGCGAQPVFTDTGGSSAGTGTAAGTTAKPAAVGDSLTLSGVNGLKLAVTVTKVVDPEHGGRFDRPDSGDRYVGVFIRLRNVGATSYEDSPSSGSQLLPSGGEQARGVDLTSGGCSGDFSTRVVIAPKSAQTGCIAFELPRRQAPATFRFTLNAALRTDTGVWNLARAPGARTSTSTSTSPSTPSPTTATTTGTRARPGTKTSTTGTGTHGRGAGGKPGCIANVTPGPQTSCELAKNVFDAVARAYRRTQQFPSQVTVSDPITTIPRSFLCSFGTGVVNCVTESGPAGPSVTFPQRAVLEYGAGTGATTTGTTT